LHAAAREAHGGAGGVERETTEDSKYHDLWKAFVAAEDGSVRVFSVGDLNAHHSESPDRHAPWKGWFSGSCLDAPRL
jgi:hypothetical protein